MSHEFAQRAKENLRVLRTQKEIAEQIVDYACHRLTIARAREEISKTAIETIASRFHHELKSIDREYDQNNNIVQLYALESSHVYLTNKFNETITQLSTEIKNVREALKDYSGDVTTDDPTSPIVRTDAHLLEPLNVSALKPRPASKFLLLFLIIVPLIVFLPYTFGLLATHSITNSSGIVASVDLTVYQDAEGTRVVETLDWKTLYPGQEVTQVIYVMNTGNVNTTLHMEAANWNPSVASGYITISWDLPLDNPLSPGVITPIQIRLSVSNNIQNIQEFTFDILLTSNPILSLI